MDIHKAIEYLKAEKKRLDLAIAALEGSRGRDEEAPGRPGRKIWNGDARRAAAERMRKYWEEKRKASAESPGKDQSPE